MLLCSPNGLDHALLVPTFFPMPPVSLVLFVLPYDLLFSESFVGTEYEK